MCTAHPDPAGIRYPHSASPASVVSVQVYGPDGLGKTAKGGHPRRRLSQASLLELGPPPSTNGTAAGAKAAVLPDTTAAGGGALAAGGLLALGLPASGGGVLSKAAAADEGFDEDGGMEDDEARRTQLQEAGALKAQQQAAFRLNPGLQEVRTMQAMMGISGSKYSFSKYWGMLDACMGGSAWSAIKQGTEACCACSTTRIQGMF